MDLSDGNKNPDGSDKWDGWMHYFVVGFGLIVGAFLLVTVVGVILAIFNTGFIPFLITAFAIYAFIWVVTRIVRVGRANGWFDKMENW